MASPAFAALVQEYIAQGVPPADAFTLAARAHPASYQEYVQQSRQTRPPTVQKTVPRPASPHWETWP
jgi:hypothetical protein